MTVNSGREMALLCPRASTSPPCPQAVSVGLQPELPCRGAGAEPPEPRLRPLCYSGTLGGESWPRAGGRCCSPCSLGAGFRSAARAKAGGELRGSARRGGARPCWLQPELLALRSPLTPAITPLFVHCCFFFSVIWFLTRGQHPCARAY